MLNTFRRLHDVHGNERIGVKVLDVLRLALLGAAPLSTANNLFPRITRGSVTLVYGNPRAQRIGKRGSEPHADLNRCFPRNLLEIPESKLDSSYEHHRAKKLAPLFASSDLLVDLHSTNKPSPPFVRLSGYDKVPSQLMEISGRLPTKMLLLDPKHLIGDGNVALTDEFVGVHGGMGICYESGLASDLSQAKIDSITRSVLQILHYDMEAIEFVDADGQIRSSENVMVNEVVDVVDVSTVSERRTSNVFLQESRLDLLEANHLLSTTTRTLCSPRFQLSGKWMHHWAGLLDACQPRHSAICTH
ncbi:hypothetical protein PC113_g19553 [Phytophthora cactorum]|uniref:Succinylglutamate desuccinylase/Aspartoacylase catalytic domain-containing protein n=1 Tax=Phytophthora cactorum TaxID=29920 RepID=A0A8T1BM63_9STRA|nr:hypothetical protein PC113_g19553 [Phytophthora cactorum]KAG2881729.1 hypothetical protein PC114_g21417 [Phytophthora cactorum]KAG2903331.1 hypothetical protein PC117_g21271 [Phytophthora cactorum]KAG3061573.1 hypothetical protein PC122_g19599 [Phytophthora cactorum]KAG3135445.1 hypothetical protein C6341_g21764 [Phytophthora cactorum]